VPRVGLEPTLLAEPDFESGASTNFTTRAAVKPDRIAQRSGSSQWVWQACAARTPIGVLGTALKR
jgi:hypothetical protein